MTRLLAVGDIHLGRLPASLPDDLIEQRHSLGPEVAWQRAVAEAIRESVEGVLLAGDVVERSRDFFVAYGQLKSGIEQLAAAGIPVFAVAGNHDTHVLPRLAREIESLTLLGEGGRWEQVEVGDIDLLGWSFPTTHVRASPLAQLDDRHNERPLIGLLHCDRDQADSQYAPVSSAELAAAPVDAWLLGHIHQPDSLDGERPIGYLGSVSALRASELGARGPWLIEIEGRKVTARQRPLAPLRFEALDIDAAGLEDADTLSSRLLSATRARLESLPADTLPDALGLRVRLHGHSALAAQLPELVASLEKDARSWEEMGVRCFLDKIHSDALPELDLEQLARRADPCGLLAQRLVALGQPDSDDAQRLIQLARPRLENPTQWREFQSLEKTLSDDEIRHHLIDAARQTLIRLLDQQRAGQ